MAKDEEHGLTSDNGGLAGPHKAIDGYGAQRESKWKRYFTSDIDPVWADIPLIVCFFISGLVDSVAFDVWSCFASMQTGNTIFVGLGVSNQPSNAPPYQWAKSLLAIGCFVLGAFFFGVYHRLLGPTRRWVLVSSFVMQAAMIAIAASLATAGVVSNKVTIDKVPVLGTDYWTVRVLAMDFMDLLPLSFLSFQAAGQVVASRALKYNELPTVVVTSLFTDLMSDAELFFAKNVKRNRRIGGAIALFLGAVCGGFLVKSWTGLAGALWIAAFLKAAMAVGWSVWKAAVQKSG